VSPAGDGLAKIRSAIDTRRLRVRWRSPMVALAAAVTVGAVVAGPAMVAGVTGNARSERGVATVPGASQSPSPSPSATRPSKSADLPNLVTTWPYVNRDQARQRA
jgi:hypothetical protein